MRRRLAAIGALLIVLGSITWAVRRFWLLPTYDKDAFYLFGHWFDAPRGGGNPVGEESLAGKDVTQVSCSSCWPPGHELARC